MPIELSKWCSTAHCVRRNGAQFPRPTLYLAALLIVWISIGCGRQYCHCFRCAFGRVEEAIGEGLPLITSHIELDDVIDAAIDGESSEGKEIRRDEERQEKGKPLRYHDSRKDLQSHKEQRVWDDFNEWLDSPD